MLFQSAVMATGLAVNGSVRERLLDKESKRSDGVALCRQGSRLTITLDNPAVHNRLSGKDIACLREVFANVNEDTDIRVVVLDRQRQQLLCGV